MIYVLTKKIKKKKLKTHLVIYYSHSDDKENMYNV